MMHFGHLVFGTKIAIYQSATREKRRKLRYEHTEGGDKNDVSTMAPGERRLPVPG